MDNKKAIKLPNSDKVFGHDNGDYEEHVFLSLLEEATKKGLENSVLIKATDDWFDIPDDYDSSNLEIYKKFKTNSITVEELRSMYKQRYGMDYSIEEERGRHRFQINMADKRHQNIWDWKEYKVHMRLINNQ